MLDLISQAAATSTPKHTWPACYAAHGQTFGEVEEFISDCQQRFSSTSTAPPPRGVLSPRQKEKTTAPL